MRRLYYLLAGIEITHNVIDELLLSHVEESHIHVIAAEGVEPGDLREASLLQRGDFTPAMERGVALGGTTGLLCGLAALAMSGLAIAGGGRVVILEHNALSVMLMLAQDIIASKKSNISARAYYDFGNRSCFNNRFWTCAFTPTGA